MSAVLPTPSDLDQQRVTAGAAVRPRVFLINLKLDPINGSGLLPHMPAFSTPIAPERTILDQDRRVLRGASRVEQLRVCPSARCATPSFPPGDRLDSIPFDRALAGE